MQIKHTLKSLFLGFLVLYFNSCDTVTTTSDPTSIHNHSFEDGFAYWSFNLEGSNKINVDETISQHGTKSLKVTGAWFEGGGMGATILLSPNLPTAKTAGKYIFSYCYKIQAEEDSTKLSVYFTQNSPIITGRDTLNLENEWKKVSLNFDMGNGQSLNSAYFNFIVTPTPAIPIVDEPYPFENIIWLDNINFEKVL